MGRPPRTNRNTYAKRVTITMPESLYERVSERAAEEEITITAFWRNAALLALKAAEVSEQGGEIIVRQTLDEQVVEHLVIL